MNVVILDVLTADCELSGKEGVECVRVVLESQMPEAVIATAELVKVLRFKKKQEGKGKEARGNPAQVE